MKKSELRDTLQQIADLAATAADHAGEEPTETREPARRRSGSPNPFAARSESAAFAAAESETHRFGESLICETDDRGHATPGNLSPFEIVLDASEGFVPLWDRGVTLRWRFNESSMKYFQNPEAAKSGFRELFSEAVFAWGDAAPIGFKEQRDAWDFEVVMRDADRCNINGCTLASAFFPDAGRHELVVYPQMFTQSREEQVETLVHEVGHVFGLRHFFAQVSESAWPSEVFGTHQKFSIMNYGSHSQLTAEDKADLRRLYQETWRGGLGSVNGTPVRLVLPYHESGRRA